MKGLKQGKLSSSPYRTFLVVIHSWQKPVLALTACVTTYVWCRLLPPSLQCLLPCTSVSHCAQLLPVSVLNIVLALQDMTFSFWGFVIYISVIHERENTLIGVSPKKSVWDQMSENDVPLHECEWRREINAAVFHTCSLPFLCIYSHFIQWAHNPHGFSVRPGKGGSEGGYRWISLPSLSSLMPCVRKSHYLWCCLGWWGLICKSVLFFFFALRID